MRTLYIETLYVTFIQDLQQHSLSLLDSICSTVEVKYVYGACEKLCCQHVFLVLLFLPIVYFHPNHVDFIKHVSQLCSALMYPVGSDHTWGKVQTQYLHLLCYLTRPSHLSELRVPLYTSSPLNESHWSGTYEALSPLTITLLLSSA